MTQDASLPQHAPMTTTNPTTSNINNTSTSTVPDVQCNGHGEVDASSTHSKCHASLQQVCADFESRVTSFLDAVPATAAMQRTQAQTKVALSVMAEALQKYDFEALSFSYNGGKDCLVLLILYLSALHKHYKQQTTTTTTGFPTTIPSIYAKPPDPFPQVTSFVETSSQTYHLSLTHISTNPGPNPKYRSHSSPPKSPITDEQTVITFRDAFALYLKTNPKVQAIFVGTRRTDPHGDSLQHFQMTDGNWPSFMRIHPVIDWHLNEIWLFLRSPHLADPKTGKGLEYCSIYDEGYTSLGGVNDTLRNPRLRFVDDEGVERYRPAYELTEDDEERLGRE